MYVHVKPTRKLRILAFFMAFAIIFVSLPYVGIETSAADGDSAVVTSSKSASVSGSYAITGGTANYTGKILDYADSSVDLFDYKSDQELDSANGSTITSSHASNYTDQHTYLNTAISEGNNYLVSLAANNITIAFSDSTVQSTDTVYVHLWDSVNNTSNNYETKWPGRKMTYDNGLGKFVYTFCPSVLGFTPDSLIFNGGNNTWQTGTIKLYETLEVGNTYSFTKESHGDVKIVLNVTGGASGSSMKIYLWNDSGNTGWVDDDPTESMVCVSGTQFSYNTGNKTWKNIIFYRKTSSGTRWQTNSVTNQTFNYGYTYTYSVNVTNTDWSGSSPRNPSVTATSNGSVKSYTKTSGSRDIYSQYKIPLYFGCFYNPNWTKGYKAAYNNFFWQPNMSLRTDSSASVQQLVDTTLGTSGELKCDGKELPYFSRTLADSDKYKYDFNGTQRNMIECYDDLDFKFYQIQTDAANVRGHDASDTGKSNFYQFNSQETHLYFDGTELTESTEAIKSQGTVSDANGTTGFYPFHSTNNSQLNNLAFGAKFTIRFKLGENGKVETVNPANGNGTGKYVNEVFEFRGDDDVWVFIDGKLVLDLGGVHKDTSGYIDFAERKAVATSAVSYADASQDNLNATANSIPKENTNVGTGSETFAFTDLLKDKDYYRTHKKYDPETVHTMTLFYMERGMYESDLLVRFNFETVSNKNTLKVSEVTDFTDVNEGLREITQKAADNDVFQYTVYNKGTVNDDTRNSEILTPTFDAYTRNNAGYSTKLSGLETITDSDPESIFLDVTNWSGDYKYAVWYAKNSSRWLRIGEKVEIGDAENIYKFSVPDSDSFDYFRFLKLNGSDTSVDGNTYPTNSPPDTAQINSSPSKGALYKKKQGSGADLISDSYTITYSPTVTRTTNNFAPGSALPNPLDYVAVTNTNYLWTDEYSSTTGTDGKPLAGTTDNTTGSFPLMYGTNGTAGTAVNESSALFKYQFKTDSDMKVVQSNTLAKPADREHAPFTTSTSARNVSSYYKTSVTIKDKYGRVVTNDYDDHDFSGNDAETTFDYVNSSTTQAIYPKDPVEITEEFTNRVLVGDITVSKELTRNDTVTDEFEFRLTLTNVLGQDGVNVFGSGYGNITITGDSGLVTINNDGKLSADGRFKLKKGGTATISGIPAGTHYVISEITKPTYYDLDNTYIRTGTDPNYTYSEHNIKGDIAANETAVYKAVNTRKTGTLTLTKTVKGETNANSQADVSNKSFNFKVTITEPTGVVFDGNYTIQEKIGSGNYTDLNYSTWNYSSSTKTYTFTKSISATSSYSLKGIPYGSTYTVTEIYNTSDETETDPDKQTKTYTIKDDDGSPASFDSISDTIEHGTTVANITNTYRKITLTKKDNKDTGKNLNGAKYVLVRLKDAAISGDALTSDAVTAFNRVTESSDFTASPLSTYVEDYSSVLTTGTNGVSANDGKIVVKDNVMAHGITPGKYFFIEIEAPTDYKKNNDSSISYNNNGSSATANKIFTITDGTSPDPTHEVTYYNERKTGTLTLYKTVTLGSGTTLPSDAADKGFAYDVTLTGPSGLDLSNFSVSGTDSSNNAVNLGTLTNNSYHFTVTVHSSDTNHVTFTNLPYGTTYSVYESSTLPSSISTDSDSTAPVSGEIGEGGTKVVNATATITNTYNTGSLTISKNIAGDSTNTNYSTDKYFTFTVTLTPETSDFVDLSKYSFTDSTLKITNTSNDHKTITLQLKHGESTTIGNIPLGTKYTVAETDPSDESTVTYQINSGSAVNNQYSTPSGDGNTNTITSTAQTVAFINTYPAPPTPVTYKSITLTKTDLNGNPLSGVTFALLKLNSSAVVGNSDFASSNSGDYSGLSSYYDAVYGTKTTDASGRVTFTEEQDGITTFATGDRYFFYEVSVPAGSNIIIDNSLTDAKIITISDGTDSYNTTYKNSKTLSSVDVTVKKVDESDPTKGLEDAEFELWYKDSTVHPTYTFNDPLTAPLKTNALKVSGTGITVPAAAAPSSYTTYDYTYTYDYPSTPSATETEWILPRTDNDYIYFRDFESGTADHDPGLSKHAWLDTSFEINTYSQEQEINYTHNYWVAAQFTKNGSDFVEYAVWERFVDRYSGFDTVVWKIQPPDGYNKVRFCLYDGSNCIRTTEEFEYQLGKIYKKTSWGDTYRYQNNNHCYFNVPVDSGTNWSTYYTTASTAGNDQRNANTTNLNQAERYTPTEQKIIFHCNSQQVWHNIHIEFFGSDGTTTVGQKFPGYMMEPYAYAGSDYRLSNGYLTYELTIPKGASYFRINNGVSLTGSSPYAYRTEIKPLNRTGSTKNYGNYFILGTDINTRYNCLDNSNNPKEATLSQNVNVITNLSHEDTSTKYSSNEVESDCDYIYFAKKKTSISWNGHIYAYFYGGGNLREDNWQRACYSIWPGVAPVGSQFNDGSDHNSTIYDYTPSANPESTFEITKGSTAYTVYKFRLPEGDRKNYSKVIFNDGLSKHSGGKETSPITYNAGYIYYEDGGSKKHFENYSTEQYTARGGADDYLYIKTSDSSWDDMHITFYDANGTQIHQGGKGYVMNYSGTIGGEAYYRIAIPNDAAKFKLNNGRDKATTLETDFGDILRKSDGTGEGTNTDYTKGKIVYTLTSPNTLAMVKLFNETQTNSVEHTTGTQDSGVDYTPTTRNDKLYILDSAPWNIGIGGGKVKFYAENGSVIGTKGIYTLIESQPDSNYGNKKWYSIEIPDNAVSFTLTYNNGANTTARNPIYPKSADGTGIDGSYTTGNMYYETTTGGALSLMTTTVSPAATETDITAAKRGDTLYLLCASETAWKDMTVTFLNSSGTAITGAAGITANYIGLKDSDHWWSISIPTGAASFTVTKGVNTTAEAEIYPLSTKLSRYKKDYTLGDMQYRLPAPAASSKPDLLYPIFTQDDEYTLEVGGKTISSSSGTALVDESDIANYVNASAVTTPSTTGVSEPTSPYPVLYETATDNLTYSWTESVTGDGKLRFDNSVLKWDTVKVDFYNSGSESPISSATVTDSTGIVVAFEVPSNATRVKFSKNGSTTSGEHTEIINRSSNSNLKNYKYTPATTSTIQTNENLYIGISKEAIGDHFQQVEEVEFFTDNGTYISSLDNDVVNWEWSYGNGNDQNVYRSKISVPSNAYQVQFKVRHNNGNVGESNHGCITTGGGSYQCLTGMIRIKTSGSNTAQVDYVNQFIHITNSGYWNNNQFFLNWTAVNIPSSNAQAKTVAIIDSSGTDTWTATTTGSSDTTYTATYQPEDRYGFITSRDDYSTTLADPDNFIYISTTISDPYITFYDSNNSAIGGNNMATAGIKLLGVCGNSASLYKIRLPRNAKSFKLADGASGTLGTAISLEEDITVNAETGQPANSGNTVTVSGYRHAGTTFTVDSSGTVTSKTLRSGFTISKTATLSETSPKSDIDYVFFTDTSNTIKGSDGTVYAYFYGDADGEFAKWPGIQAESSYTDNAGKTVYRFRIPKDTNGTYAKVIFNNGSATDGTRRITQAADATGGHNYTLNTASTAQYGTYNGTNAITAYAVADSTKATATNSAVYGSNKYIYIYNNGTQNLTNGVDTGRYTLDEMHVIFYDINNAPIGSADSGYIPDKLSSYPDYYRMQVPNGAVYFQITNGTGKGTGSNYYSRQSEIKQITANGLYKFVDEGTNAADYITADSTVPTGNNATREAPKYLLTLKNEKKAELDDDVPETSTFDVKLAVVVTGSNGQIDHIKWLKQKNGEVDQAYLNHTNADVGEGKGITTVKVVKNGTYYWKEVVAPAGYELNENIFEFIKTDSTLTGSNITGGSITVTDKKISGKVILTKTAKEKVGTTNIGDTLAGAQFKLVKVNGNSEDTSLRFTLTTVEGKNTYSLSSSSASYNNIGYWLTTGSDGKLTIEGLSPGDYYLEEQTAPAGFVATDSNNVVNGTAQKKKVYFSIGDNTTTKYLTCSDEMAPAYIKLYEHINEKLPAWGDPTFIFKITKSGGKTSYVALTVDDNGGLAANEDDTVLGTAYNAYKYIESTDELEGESPNQTLEYQGMYHIDNQGRIRLEPGTYSITRVPVSRYEFVADTFTDSNTSTFTANTTGAGCATGLEAAVSVTVNEGDTAIVHYYDKVAYYDKFSHVDEEINKFYTLDASKNNTTAKGIRVEFNGKADTSGTATIYTNLANDTSAGANRFNAWFINVDGTEREMTVEQKEKLEIEIPSGLPSDFEYISTNHTLSINNAQSYANNVYTLTAVYKDGSTDLFETTFDLVFARS